jgi:hypothetical protein
MPLGNEKEKYRFISPHCPSTTIYGGLCSIDHNKRKVELEKCIAYNVS